MPKVDQYPSNGNIDPDDTFLAVVDGALSNVPSSSLTSYLQGRATAMTLNTQTGNYTLALADANNNVMVAMNAASANTCTVPPNSSVAYPVGSQIEILQLGLGQTTIVEGSGVTVGTATTLKLASQYSRCVLLKTATNTWLCSGEMATTLESITIDELRKTLAFTGNAITKGGWNTMLGAAASWGIPAEAKMFCYRWPWVYYEDATITDMACHVETAGGTGSVLRMGVYADDNTGKPGALIVDAGTTATATSGTKTISSLTGAVKAFQPLWIAVVTQGVATPRASYYRIGNATAGAPNILFQPDTASGRNAGDQWNTGNYQNLTNGWFQSSVSGALPGTFTYSAANTFADAEAPRVTMRVA